VFQNKITECLADPVPSLISFSLAYSVTIHNRQFKIGSAFTQGKHAAGYNHRGSKGSYIVFLVLSMVTSIRRHSPSRSKYWKYPLSGVSKTKSQESLGSVPFLYLFFHWYSVTITIGRQIVSALCQGNMGWSVINMDLRGPLTSVFCPRLVNTITVTKFQKTVPSIGVSSVWCSKNPKHRNLGIRTPLSLFHCYSVDHHNRPSN